MKLNIEEILSKKELLHREIIRSFDNIPSLQDGTYEIKLLINGVEKEPKLLNDLLNNIESYIDKEAKFLLKEKYEELNNSAQTIQELIDKAILKLND